MIYLVVLIILLCFTFSPSSRRERYYKTIASGVILVLLAGLRYRVGTDALLYQDIYEIYPTIDEVNIAYIESSRWGIIFVYFFSFCHTLINSFVFYQFLHAIIVTTVVLYLCYRNTKLVFPAFVLYVVNYYFYFTFDLYREGLAAALFYFAYERFLLKNKRLPYYLLCVVCYNIHVSSFLIFFVPLLLKIELTKHNSLVTLVVVFLLSFLLFRYIQSLLLLLPFGSVTRLAQHYLVRYQENKIAGMTLMRFGLIFVSYYFAVYRNVGKTIGSQKGIINLAFVSIVLLALEKAVPFVFRLNSYFIVFFFIAVGIFVEREIFVSRDAFKRIVFYLLILFVVSSSRLMPYFTNEITRNAYFPYVSIIDQEKIRERELFHWNHDYDDYDKL